MTNVILPAHIVKEISAFIRTEKTVKFDMQTNKREDQRYTRMHVMGSSIASSGQHIYTIYTPLQI